MRQGHPAWKIPHAAIFAGLQNKVPMIGHQLIAQDSAWISLQSFSENSLESMEVGIVPEHDTSRIATIQCVVVAIGFVCMIWSWQSNTISGADPQINDS
jgi:hypothetical protein